MGRFRHSRNELVQEYDLSLLVIDVRLHMHPADIRMISKVVSERAVMSLRRSERARQETANSHHLQQKIRAVGCA